MAAKTLICPKCDQEMEDGFLMDLGHGDMGHVGSWVKGKPEYGWFYMKLFAKDRRAIKSYRCINCGYLENYAVEPYDG